MLCFMLFCCIFAKNKIYKNKTKHWKEIATKITTKFINDQGHFGHVVDVWLFQSTTTKKHHEVSSRISSRSSSKNSTTNVPIQTIHPYTDISNMLVCCYLLHIYTLLVYFIYKHIYTCMHSIISRILCCVFFCFSGFTKPNVISNDSTCVSLTNTQFLYRVPITHYYIDICLCLCLWYIT